MRTGDKEQSSVNMVQTVENVYFHDYLYDYDYAGSSSSSSSNNSDEKTIATIQHGLRMQRSPSTH